MQESWTPGQIIAGMVIPSFIAGMAFNGDTSVWWRGGIFTICVFAMLTFAAMASRRMSRDA